MVSFLFKQAIMSDLCTSSLPPNQHLTLRHTVPNSKINTTQQCPVNTHTLQACLAAVGLAVDPVSTNGCRQQACYALLKRWHTQKKWYSVIIYSLLLPIQQSVVLTFFQINYFSFKKIKIILCEHNVPKVEMQIIILTFPCGSVVFKTMELSANKLIF